MSESQVLIRLKRVTATLRETREAGGWTSAMTLLWRSLLMKGPLLLRQIRSGGKVAMVRANVSGARAAAPAYQPYLAFIITGGVGDYIVIARFIRDLAAQIGDLQFDVFSPNPKLAAWTFAKTTGFRSAYYDLMFEYVLAEYDVGMRVNQFAIVYAEKIRWKSVRDNHALIQIINRLVSFRPKIEAFVDRHPLLDNFLARTAVFGNATRRDFLQLTSGVPYGGDRLTVPQNAGVLSRLGLRAGHYVTVHNGFDTGFVITGQRATKCYPYFGAVVAELKQTFPDVQFVQVGTITSEPIAECDLILLDKTTLDDVVGLLAQAAMHLDNEGGLVHLAACVGTRSTVVFGPTPSDYFGYPNNVNIDPPVCGNCWWMTRTWMDRCAKGYSTPRCMTEQDPSVVAAHAMKAIAEAMSKRSEALPDSNSIAA